MSPDESEKSSLKVAPMYPDTSEQDCTIGARYTYCPPMSGRRLGCIDRPGMPVQKLPVKPDLLTSEELANLQEETSGMIAALRSLSEVLNEGEDEDENSEK